MGRGEETAVGWRKGSDEWPLQPAMLGRCLREPGVRAWLERETTGVDLLQRVLAQALSSGAVVTLGWVAGRQAAVEAMGDQHTGSSGSQKRKQYHCKGGQKR